MNRYTASVVLQCKLVSVCGLQRQKSVLLSGPMWLNDFTRFIFLIIPTDIDIYGMYCFCRCKRSSGLLQMSRDLSSTWSLRKVSSKYLVYCDTACKNI